MSEEAQFEYRCRRCGVVSRNPCCSTGLAHHIIVEVLMRGEGGDALRGGKVYAHATHACADGGVGLADMMGYRVKEVG